MASLTEKIAFIETELRQLEKRRTFLLQSLYDLKAAQSVSETKSQFTPLEKLKIFARLFVGRRDVYARGFKSAKYQKMGYSPACANADSPSLCRKGQIRCSQCPNRKFADFNLQVIKNHLQGKDQKGRRFTAGLYPLMSDDTCKVLVVDFDSERYKEEALAFLETCDRYHLPVYLERSRSGNGAHIWFFFDQFVKAASARKMGTLLLEETMSRSPALSFDSFDRLIPNQDMLPSGGFGNLIALPLQRIPRYQGNSVFVDRNFEPYPDQWSYLLGVQRTSLDVIRRVIEEIKPLEKETLASASKQLGYTEKVDDFEIKPWEPQSEKSVWEVIAQTQQKPLSILLADGLYFDKSELPPKLKTMLTRLASFANPVFYERQMKRLSTRGVPRYITCFEEKGNYLLIPRGLKDKVLEEFDSNGISYQLTDKRSLGQLIKATFKGTLRPKQSVVANHVLKSETGVLCAGTGFGKTVLGLYAVAQRCVSTLIITNRKQLLDQWVLSAEIFLDLPPNEIGTIKAGKVKPTGVLDVAMAQTLAHQKHWETLSRQYGMIIVDECHHAASLQFETILKRFQSKYVLGLSATPYRRDGHLPIVYMQCGPIRYRVNLKKENKTQPVMHVLEVHETPFKSELTQESKRIQETFKELIENDARNRVIVQDIEKAYQEGRFCLVITERKEHLERLKVALSGIERLASVCGNIKTKERQKELERFKNFRKEEGGAVLLATGKLVGEGFDSPQLDTLFLTMPISDRSLLIQYVGRLHRLCDQKHEVRVIDYRDSQERRLEKMFAKRLKIYKAIGYEERFRQKDDFLL